MTLMFVWNSKYKSSSGRKLNNNLLYLKSGSLFVLNAR